MPKQKTSDRVLLIAKILLTIAALGIAFKDIAIADLIRIFRTQNHILLLDAAFFLGIQIVLGGERWRIVLHALERKQSEYLKPQQAQRIYYVSNFFTCCLPGAVGGDVIRVLMAKGEHVPTSLSVYSVLIDRLVALLGIGSLILIMLPVLAEILPINIWLVYSLSFLALVVAVVLFVMSERILLRFVGMKFTDILLRFTRVIKTVFQQPKSVVLVVIMALTAHISYAISGYYIARSLEIDITMTQCIALIPVIMLVITVPISMGGWGVREAAMVGLLNLIHVPAELAVMLSLQMGFLFIFVSLPGSVLWFSQRKKVPQEKPL